MTHRVKRKYIYRIEGDETVRYDVGDEFEATDQEIELLGDRLEPVESSEDDVDEEVETPFDPREMTVSEIRDYNGEFDRETVDRLHALEESESDRQTAHNLMERYVTEG